MTAPSEKRPLTAEDLFKFQMIDDPQVSPDGTQVAFVKTWLNEAQNNYRANIFVMDLANKETRQLTHGERQDTRPRWSPDGQVIVYLASVEGSSQSSAQDVASNVAPASDFLGKLPQLHVISSSGGTAKVITDLAGGVQGHTWSPDGQKVAFTTLVSAEDEPLNSDGQDLFATYNQDVLVTTRVRWKSDAIGLVGDYFRHIAVVDIDTGALTASPPRLLTQGETDFGSPKWSPNGSQLAVVGNLETGAEWQRKAFIYLLDANSDTPEPKELVGLEEMRSNDLAFSPDGTQLAVCGHDDPIKGHYGLQKLWLIGTADGSKTCVSEHIDMSFGDFSRNQDMRRYGGDDGPHWAADGRSLLLLTNVAGSVNLAAFSLGDKTLKPLTEGNHAVFAFSADANQKTVVTLITDNVNPCDLFQVTAADANGYNLTQLTSVNQDFLDAVTLSIPEKFEASSSGVPVDGWIYPPVNVQAGQTYPVILYTGGGPGGMRANVFCHEWQVYANQGYAVINCNARGNYGYGEAHSLATRGEWGDLDGEDNMAFLKDALAHYPYMDKTRIAVAGGSYGGYMAAWLTSHHDVFKASVVDRSLYNRLAFHNTGDIGFLLDKIEFESRQPWDDPQVYLERSPAHYVKGIKTPTLVVHSEKDYRCPIGNGEQLYMALRRLDIPTKLVRFPNETHELSRGGRPWHRVFRLHQYAAWFKQWV